MKQRMKIEDVQLLEQLFILEGIFFDPNSTEETEAAYEDVISATISSLQEAVKVLNIKVEEVMIYVYPILLSSIPGTDSSSWPWRRDFIFRRIIHIIYFSFQL